jgi:hypothetical protein
MEGFLLPSIPSTRSGQSTGSKRFHMTDPCVICCGRIRRRSTDGD